MKIVIDLSEKEIERLGEMIGVLDPNSEDDISDAIHVLIEVAG